MFASLLACLYLSDRDMCHVLQLLPRFVYL